MKKILLFLLLFNIGFTQTLPTAIDSGNLLQWFIADSAYVTFSLADSVSLWEDQSGNGYDAYQSSIGNMPRLKPSIYGSYDAMRFDGVADYFTNDSINLNESACTIFMVLSGAANSSAYHVTFLSYESLIVGTFNDSDNWGVYMNANLPSSYDLDGTAFYIIANRVRSYNDLDLITNDVLENQTGGSGWQTTTGKSIGGSSGQFWSGDILEIVVYDVALSNANKDLVMSYLNAKYGIYKEGKIYIDPDTGDDTYSGFGPGAALASFDSINTAGLTLVANDTLAIRTGTTVRGQLTIPRDSIYVTKYDSTGESGADPIISGADLVSGFGVDAISSLAASEVSGATTGEGLRKFSATTYLGQGFNIANVGTFDSCVVWVEKNGTPTGNMWAEIWDISAGKPNAIIANGVSDSVDVSTIANPHEWIQLIFNDSPTASVGDYALVLRGDYAGDATDFIEWGVNYAGTYLTQAEPYCKFLDNDGASWASETARDHNFKIYVALPVWSVALTTEPNRIFFDGRSAPTTDWSWAANKLYILTDDTVNVEVTQRNICIDLDDESYITIDGIHITKSNRHGIENATSSSTTVTNNIIQNCTIDLCGWSGIESGNDSNDLGNNFTVQYCVIDSNGILLNNHHGIYINYGKNWVVQYNSFTGNIGYGVQIQNNADSNIVRYNTTTGNISGGFVIFDDGGGGCNDNQIYYNISNGDRDGIQVGGTADNATNLIYNNVFYGFTQYGLRVDGDPTLGTVKNNIFWSSESGAEIFHDEDGAADMTSDYNILGPESSNFIQWRGTQYSTLATFVSGESQDANSLNVDPLFTSATDFNLQPGSPAINAGVSVGLVLDYVGKTVPFNILPDIGAYESQVSLGVGGKVYKVRVNYKRWIER